MHISVTTIWCPLRTKLYNLLMSMPQSALGTLLSVLRSQLSVTEMALSVQAVPLSVLKVCLAPNKMRVRLVSSARNLPP